jgi:PPM family protein phosphatase
VDTNEQMPDASPADAGEASTEFCVAAYGDRGRKRVNNEDNYLVFDLQLQAALVQADVILTTAAYPTLLAVADGMGGHQSGEVASQTCLEELPRQLLTRFVPEAEDSTAWQAALRDAIQATNETIFELASHRPEHQGMGTTLTVALLVRNRALLAQVGDSRAYLLHAGVLTQLTRDQTVGNSLADVDPAAAAVIDRTVADMLVQAIGTQRNVEAVLSEAELVAGDSLLLCSDGLYKVVSPDEILTTLASTSDVASRAQTLISLANANGGPDNITVILCEVRKASGGAI